MSSFSDAGKIVQAYIDYCVGTRYQVRQTDESNYVRLDISNLVDKINIIIYKTGSVVIGGKASELKNEMIGFKAKFEADPKAFLGEVSEVRACAVTYNIIVPDLREEIKASLSDLEGEVEIIAAPTPAITYRAKISRSSTTLTITQFNNGTLLLQGKEDKLMNDYCDHIEENASPSEKDIVARFISSDEKNLEKFVSIYTPQLLLLAENNVKAKLGQVYDYLDVHDRKWFVASECLCLAQIPLPEYSPLVMPASKAFEGFSKKLLVGINLFDTDYFKKKQSTFAALNDPNDPKRKAICTKDKYAETMLKKVNLCLDMNRNFMMHSDDSNITKIDQQNAAEQKISEIINDMKELFAYFSALYKLQP